MQMLVKAKGLRKSYRNRTVVDGIDLAFRRGETVAIIGPNGAGKSTTLDMILGLKKAAAAPSGSGGTIPSAASASNCSKRRFFRGFPPWKTSNCSLRSTG